MACSYSLSMSCCSVEQSSVYIFLKEMSERRRTHSKIRPRGKRLANEHLFSVISLFSPEVVLTALGRSLGRSLHRRVAEALEVPRYADLRRKEDSVSVLGGESTAWCDAENIATLGFSPSPQALQRRCQMSYWGGGRDESIAMTEVRCALTSHSEQMWDHMARA